MMKNIREKAIGLVGLGLIGGSMAKAIAAQTHLSLFAWDQDACVMDKAFLQGLLAGQLDGAALEQCGWLLLALYPEATLDYVKQNVRHIAPGTVVIDLCGVKRALGELYQLSKEHGFIYVGGHPMAGTEKIGFDYSRADLFAGASMILTPPDWVDLLQRERMDSFFRTLGFGRIQWSTPEEHDRVIAYTSQLSHVLSSAYIKSPTAKTQAGFSAGSFRDMTRVAWLNEDMWTQLFLENADYLAQETEALAERLLEYAKAIRQGDRERLKQMLVEGKLLKEEIENGCVNMPLR